MGELPKRKQIRLKEYDYSQDGAYFVTICTEEKVHLFSDAVGAALCGRPNHPKEMVERWVSEIRNKFKTVEIEKYIIMPNHIHFIVTLAGGHAGPPLQDVVAWFKTMTTNAYIRGVKAGIYSPFHKRVWQRGYYEHVIRNDEDYLSIWQYIDQNPAKWTEDCYFSAEGRIHDKET